MAAPSSATLASRPARNTHPLLSTEPTFPPAAAEADIHLATLANGLRVVAIRMPQRATVSLSVFVRTGSQHESRRLNGISHVVEHMAFKGTQTRDCQRINLDAERLGAEVNAHTDKDHTAFHLEGLARDLGAFVPMLADIVLNSTFPEEELERERQVILHEYTEYEEDPALLALALFDRACFGPHPLGQPVIGTRANLRRLARSDLLAYVGRQYTAANVVVAAAGAIDAERFVREVETAFSAMPAGAAHVVAEPGFLGGIRSRRLGGHSQCHAVLGFAAPSLRHDPVPHALAAALFGEGMSSPLLDEIRERRGLAYYAACSADIGPLAGQFVVEAATAPEQAEEFLVEVTRLLQLQAEHADPAGLQRARNQLAVRALRGQEQPARLVEAAALDTFTFGRPRSTSSYLERLAAVTATDVRAVFAGMLASPVAAALAGRVPTTALDRLHQLADSGGLGRR